MIDYKDLDKTAGFSKLKAIKPFDIKRNLNAKRIEGATIKEAGTLVYNYGAMPVDDETIKALQALADEQQLIEKYRALLSGEVMNTGEKRMVLHHLTRGRVLDNVKVFSYTLENNNRDIGELLPGIVSFCEQNEADDKQTNLVNLVIEEICVSIINQTFTGDEHEYIQVTLSKDPNGEFTMHLRNSAKRFNPFEQKQSMNDEEEDILNSLGFIMVRKKAKEFHYRYYTGYNLLTVVL